MIAERALPGFVRVGLARTQAQPWALRAGGGYGFTELFSGFYGPTHRASGDLAVAYSPIPEISVALDLSGRLDAFAGGDEGVNAYGEPRLTARGVVWENDVYALAVQADARFIGAELPSVQWGATSPSLVGLFSAALGAESQLGFELGLHWDRSAQAVSDANLLSSADRLTLGASRNSQIRVGMAFSQRLPSSGTVWLAEFRTDLLAFDAAPPLEESPMTLSLGARHPFHPSFGVQANLDLGFSARPPDFTNGQLIPIGPRAALALALVYTPKKEAKRSPVTPEPEPPPPRAAPVVRAAPEPVLVAVSARVVDESGVGVPDAEIRVRVGDQERDSVWTAADGTFRIADLEERSILTLEVHATGYDPRKLSWDPSESRTSEIMVYESLPRGLIRGVVRNIAGHGLAARVTVEPGGPTVEVAPDGAFQIELAPGTHRLLFECPGYASEARSVVVVENGVVILDIGLTH